MSGVVLSAVVAMTCCPRHGSIANHSAGVSCAQQRGNVMVGAVVLMSWKSQRVGGVVYG
jgi:hypothetical protein